MTLTPAEQANANARARARMTLKNVVAGPVTKPLRVLVYGVDGIGKSTFAANAPAPIFVGLEDGTSTLDVKRFPQPQGWLDVLAALDELESADHAYSTVVLDPLDWIEPLLWEHICATTRINGKAPESIGDIPYGNGYSSALDSWRLLCARLDRLRSTRGIASILIAHAWVRQFRNPDGEDYDRYELKLHNKAAGLLREWSDIVLFATHEQYTHKQDNRAKGISTGARILMTQRTAAYDAKNRHNLPPTLPLDWQAFRLAVDAGQPAEPGALREQIAALLAGAAASSLGDSLLARVTAAVGAAGDDAAKLARIASHLAAEISIREQQQNQQPTTTEKQT